jgi:hypothetical protein
MHSNNVAELDELENLLRSEEENNCVYVTGKNGVKNSIKS